MNWNDDIELAQRVAEISSFTFEEALEAIQESEEERWWMLGTVEHHEQTRQREARIREAKRKQRRARPRLFSW